MGYDKDGLMMFFGFGVLKYVLYFGWIGLVLLEVMEMKRMIEVVDV